MSKYLTIGKVNNILKRRWPEALILWQSMKIKSSSDRSYQVQFDDCLLNGSTLELRELITYFGKYLGCIDFRNNVNAIDTALYIVRQRNISTKNIEGVKWDAKPIWDAYDGVELRSCSNKKSLNNGIFTLYGHLKTGEVEALYYCSDPSQCRELAKKVVIMNDWFDEYT